MAARCVQHRLPHHWAPRCLVSGLAAAATPRTNAGSTCRQPCHHHRPHHHHACQPIVCPSAHTPGLVPVQARRSQAAPARLLHTSPRQEQPSRRGFGPSKSWTAPPPPRLKEIGQATSEMSRPYHAGQFFVHRLLGYRGVVLVPWMAPMATYPHTTAGSDEALPDPETAGPTPEDQAAALIASGPAVGSAERRVAPFYQVLVDARDIEGQWRNEVGTTWIHPSGSVNSMTGVDFVEHGKMLPYNPPPGEVVFVHPHFKRFFDTVNFDHPQVASTVVVKTAEHSPWQQRLEDSLAYSSVFRLRTGDVEVTVIPMYGGPRLKDGKHEWWYKISIVNLGTRVLQLMNHSYHVSDVDNAHRQTFSGSGVHGRYPLLNPTKPVYQYTARVTLDSPGGTMGGNFELGEVFSSRKRGKPFRVLIPTFQLSSEELERRWEAGEQAASSTRPSTPARANLPGRTSSKNPHKDRQ